MDQVDPDGRVAAQIPGHLPGLRGGGFQYAAPVCPLQGKILEVENPPLVAGLVEIFLRYVGVDPDGVHAGFAYQGGVHTQPLLS